MLTVDDDVNALTAVASGLNAHETIASLAESYAEPAREAGVLHQEG